MSHLGKETPPAGYTIMEIMIVIVLLATIASMAIPSYRNLVERQKCSNMKIKLKTGVAIAKTYFYRGTNSVNLTQMIPDAGTDPDYDYSPNSISGTASIDAHRKVSSGLDYRCSAAAYSITGNIDSAPIITCTGDDSTNMCDCSGTCTF